MKKIIALVLSIIITFSGICATNISTFTVEAADDIKVAEKLDASEKYNTTENPGAAELFDDVDYSNMLDTALSYEKALVEKVDDLKYGDSCEWALMDLARTGNLSEEDGKEYYRNLLKHLYETKTSILDKYKTKSTENAKVVILLSAMGIDAQNVGGYNLLEAFADMKYVKKQGVNGPIFALIALDTRNYEIPKVGDGGEQATREKFINYILDAQTEDGGWGIGIYPYDPDMTAMAVTALAPYYGKNEKVSAAVEKALDRLSGCMNDLGQVVANPNSTSIVASSETQAQVIVALSSLGTDVMINAKFTSNEKTLMDALASFYDKETGAFKHTEYVNAMATEQACYALIAYDRYRSKSNRLYDMSDATALFDASEVIYVPEETPGGENGGTTGGENGGTTGGENGGTTGGENGGVTGGKNDGTTDDDTENITPEKKVKIGKCTIKSIKAQKSKMTISCKASVNVSGYQVKYSLKSSFKKSVTKKYAGMKLNKKVIKKLKSKKTYFVKVRCYYKVNGKTYYGAWTKVKKVKIK